VQVSPVQFQGECRSCWAFAAAAAIETLWASKQKVLVEISPQAFVDCYREAGFYGCSGGSRPRRSLVFAAAIKTGGGVVPSSVLPYTASTGPSCPQVFRESRRQFNRGAEVVPLDSPAPLYEALMQSPVPITIWADGLNELLLYSAGERRLGGGAM